MMSCQRLARLSGGVRRLRHRFVWVLAVLLAAPPSAAAGWGAYGSHEPDSTHDSRDFLWFDPPGQGLTPERAVYFNAFPTVAQVANENAALTGSRLRPLPEVWFEAMLGQWTDCNQDGYVGLAESAMDEYPSTLLESDALCPEGGPHNGGGWVTELLWIGTDAYGGHPDPNDPTFNFGDRTNQQNDPRILVDPRAAVWGDAGLPESPTLGAACPIDPVPQGTFQSTGGVLNDADCFDQYRVAKLVAGESVPVPVVGHAGLGVDTSVGPAQPDADNPWREPSTLNHKTFGDDDSNRSIVDYTDCSKPSMLSPLDAYYRGARATNTVTAENLPGMDLTQQGPRPPAPRVNDAPQPAAGQTPGEWSGGNVPSTWNATNEQLDPRQDCGQAYDGSASNPNGDPQDFFYHGLLGEDAHEQSGVAHKTAADWTFNFSAQERGRAYTSLGDPVDPIVYPSALAGTPDSLGLTAFKSLVPLGQHKGTVWEAQGGLLALPQGASTRSGVNLAPQFWTFYARLGNASADDGARPPGGPATYGETGAHGCSTVGAGAGFSPEGAWWDCDPTHWWRDADGSAMPQPYHFGTVGDDYELRDVDCFDGAILASPTLGFPASAANQSCDDA